MTITLPFLWLYFRKNGEAKQFWIICGLSAIIILPFALPDVGSFLQGTVIYHTRTVPERLWEMTHRIWPTYTLLTALVGLGFSHESNGRDVPVSRSWNRIFVNYVARTGSYYWSLKPWYRIPESEKDDPLDTQGDDNPDIEKYMGNFELEIARPFGNHVLEIMVRNNLRRGENKGAGRLNYSFPLTKRFKGLVQLFTGYGDSLINYDDYENRFSFGILLTDSL